MTLLDDMLALLPDNTSGEIGADDLRIIVTDLYNNAQPVDSDLTTIAGLTATTDNFLQAKASAWASRTPAQVVADLQGLVTISESQVTNLTTDLAGKQPLDSDLTAIAALTATTDSIIQAKGSAWTARTIAQLLVDLAAPGTTFQPLDSDLTTLAGLTATTDNIIQSKAGAWSSRTLAQFMVDLAALGTTFQPLDSDLTTIAGLTATTDNFLQAKSSAWASRTLAQVATDLATPLQTAGLAPKASPAFTGTATVVNQTYSGRQLNTPVALTPGATVNTDASLGNDFTLTAGQSFTLADPTNLVNGQKVLFAIRQDGTGGRVMTLGSIFRLGTDITSVVLSTAANKTDYLGCRYNGTDSKLDVLAFVKGY
jgi:acid phosphatase family membrane protein YuiD